MKNRQQRISVFVLIMAMIMVSGCEKAGLVKETETELKDGQRKATVRVVSMTGNEMTYIELTEETEEESEEDAEQHSMEGDSETGGTEAEISGLKQAEAGGRTDKSEAGAEDIPDTGEMKTGDTFEETGMKAGDVSGKGDMRTGGMPDIGMGNREMPDMSSGSGEMPDMDWAPTGGMTGTEQRDNSMHNQIAEAVTVYLPVGITVHTDTGKEMTFSILESGDELEALFETDGDGNEVITEIWMTGTGG